MTYVFDCNSLSAMLHHYYRDRFPSFWELFHQFASEDKMLSVREVYNELVERFETKQINILSESNPDFFADPTIEELNFITEIYRVSHFQYNLDKKKLMKGGAFADPFVIAKAKTGNCTVVTEEEYRKNGAKIPNICEHFGIECTKLEGFLTKENWTF